MKVTTAFTGGGLATLSLQVGRAASAGHYFPNTAITSTNEYDGPAINTGSGVSGTHNIYATLTPDASHTLAAMTAGSADIYVTYVTLP